MIGARECFTGHPMVQAARLVTDTPHLRLKLVDALRRTAIHCDRRSLNVACALGTKKQRQHRDILRLAQARQAVLGDERSAYLFDRAAARLGPLLEQLLDALSLSHTRQDRVDVHSVALAQAREPLGEVVHGRVDRAADQELRVGRARGSADDVDDVPVRALEHWPEQAAKANAAEELEREAVLPRLLGKSEERARTRGACRVDQDVAAAML